MEDCKERNVKSCLGVLEEEDVGVKKLESKMKEHRLEIQVRSSH